MRQLESGPQRRPATIYNRERYRRGAGHLSDNAAESCPAPPSDVAEIDKKPIAAVLILDAEACVLLRAKVCTDVPG